MSLSSSTAQANSPAMAFEIYKMESFDSPCATSAAGTGNCIFEPFHGESDPRGDAFQYVPSEGRQTAKETVEKAQVQAEQMVADAKKEVASIESEAYKKGFAQGEKDGLEMGTKRVDKALDRIHKVLSEIVTYKREFVGRYEKEILALVCRIAEKVVHGRARVDQSVVRESIFGAFDLAADRSEVTVKVSPEDIEYVKDLRPEFFDRIQDLKSITMESDPSIAPGGCFMETGFGQVDARLESQLEKIAGAVQEAFEQEERGGRSQDGADTPHED